MRVWARLTEPLELDSRLSAGVLTYLSDLYSGLFCFAEARLETNMTTIDHAIWLHRETKLDDWVLVDLVGESIAHGRGMYRGRISTIAVVS